MKRSKSYHDSLIQWLKNRRNAAGYLDQALEEGDARMFLVALRHVAEAHGGLSKLSRLTRLNRANLYRMLSEKGRPEIQSLHKVLEAFGLKLAIEVDEKNRERRAA